MPGTKIQKNINDSDVPSAIRDLQERGTKVVSLAAATLTLNANLHHQRTLLVNRAAGATITLPAATGSGAKFRTVVGIALTSGSLILKVANSSDVMQGFISGMSDAPATVNAWQAASTSDTITLNRTTTGVASKGEWIEVEDVGANLWQVNGMISQTGTEATPFSAAV